MSSSQISLIRRLKRGAELKPRTVLLGRHLQSHVLLLELLVGLLQVADVVDGFLEHRRLVELLGGERNKRKQNKNKQMI